jgi:hypothetical protein
MIPFSLGLKELEAPKFRHGCNNSSIIYRNSNLIYSVEGCADCLKTAIAFLSLNNEDSKLVVKINEFEKISDYIGDIRKSLQTFEEKMRIQSSQNKKL